MRSSGPDRQAWALLLPMLAIMAVVTGYPLVNTAWLSFTDSRLTSSAFPAEGKRDPGGSAPVRIQASPGLKTFRSIFDSDAAWSV